MAAEIGVILPKVRVRDNMRLPQNQYRIKIADVAVAQGTIDGNVDRAGQRDCHPPRPKPFGNTPMSY